MQSPCTFKQMRPASLALPLAAAPACGTGLQPGRPSSEEDAGKASCRWRMVFRKCCNMHWCDCVSAARDWGAGAPCRSQCCISQDSKTRGGASTSQAPGTASYHSSPSKDALHFECLDFSKNVAHSAHLPPARFFLRPQPRQLWWQGSGAPGPPVHYVPVQLLQLHLSHPRRQFYAETLLELASWRQQRQRPATATGHCGPGLKGGFRGPPQVIKISETGATMAWIECSFLGMCAFADQSSLLGHRLLDGPRA